MTQSNVRRKIVKPLAKGQVTIPAEFREALGIGPDTLLDISLVEDHLEISPLRYGEEGLRRYAQDEVSRFLEEDKLDPDVATRIREILGRGSDR